MKLGVLVAIVAATPPEHIAATVRVAEERGFHSIWCPEHVLTFDEHESRYPYNADGRIPGGAVGLVDPFDALHWIAAQTRAVRLGTGICIVPQRNPVYTAKHVADLDFLSGGRVDFGIGIGWLREEFEALGVPFERRAARTREQIALMKHLWAGKKGPFEGEFHPLPESVFGPHPIQKPHPPLFFGGNSEPALRRVADLGQGWYGHNLLPEEAAGPLTTLDKMLEERGRARDEVHRIVSPFFHPTHRDMVAQLTDLGVDQIILPFLAGDVDRLERRGDELAALVA